MKIVRASLPCILAVVLATGPLAFAQQQQSSSLTELRELVQKLEAVDKDPATPPELKEINSKFLTERRTQLGQMIEKRISILGRYQANIGPSLSAKEKTVLEDTVIALQEELARVETAMNRTSAAFPLLAVLNKPPGLLKTRANSVAPASLTPAKDDTIETNKTPARVNSSSSSLAQDDDGDNAQSDGTISVSQKFKNTSNAINPDGTINASRVQGLFEDTFGKGTIDSDIPCIIHVVMWKKPGKKKEPDDKGKEPDDKKYTTENETWYLYRDGKLFLDEDGSLRIYGKKAIAILLIHVDALISWDISYKVKATKKIPSNIQDVQRLAKLILTRDAGETLTGLWGGKIAQVPTPSDIKVTGSIKFKDEQGNKAQGDVAFNSQVYDNEGRYYWDVSVGLPVQGVKELQYKAEDGVVRPREVKRQNAYGFLNLFPTKVDVKGDDFLRHPHLVLGVPISGKPLDRPVVALGMGVGKKNLFAFDVFAGAVFNRIREPATLMPGEAATENELQSDLRSRRVTKFIFGANIPVKIFTGLLEKK